jgi:predicted ATPase
MNITKLQIADAWSFRADCPCDITFDARCTVIIGKNNSGKSNIIRGLQWAAAHLQGGILVEIARNEVHDYGKGYICAKPRIALSVGLTPNEYEKFKSIIGNDPNGPNKEEVQTSLERLLTVRFEHHEMAEQDRLMLKNKWSPFEDQQMQKGVQHKHQRYFEKPKEWLQHHIDKNITFLSGWRSLETHVEGDKSIVRVLHEMQGPDTNNPTHLSIFDKVEEFFLKLTGLQTAQLRPTADGNSLNVRYRGRYLPIQSFGDGVVHTLLMAFEFMRKQNHIFLIEEPETHLHPELIRMLMGEIAADQNNNQFIITTHSPVLLDSVLEKLTYCVKYNQDFSSITKCDTLPSLRHVLDILDVRLSDLLQANSVIWVEGPTDRMFLNRCIKLLAPTLVEGQHFQIAYYGGKLLAHYTADDNSTLLNVLKLNRHVALIADSDANNTDDTPNDTKLRLKEEIEKSGGLFWLTEGREIENYIPVRVITEVYKTLLPSHVKSDISVGKYERMDDILTTLVADPHKGDGWKVDYGANKARLMPLFANSMQLSDFTMYDLQDRMNQLIQFIKNSNSAAIY